MGVRTSRLLTAVLLVGGCSGGGAGGGGGGTSGHTREVAFPTGVQGGSPRFSPDGTKLAYRRDEGAVTALAVMSASSGADSRDLATDGDYLTAMTWSLDGAEIIYAAENDIRAVPLAGGSGRQVVNAFAAVGPDLSPDGKSLVYGVNGSDVQLADLHQTTPVVTALGTNGRAPRFSPDGRTIAYWTYDTLQLMDLASQTTTDVIKDDTNNGFGGVDWFKDGNRLLAGTDQGIEIVGLGATVTRQVIANVGALLDVDLSPDESAVAYGVNGEGSLFVLSGL